MTLPYLNKNFLLLSALLFSGICRAQDFTDTRKKTESFAKLQPRDLRLDVATFALAGISESVNTVPLSKIDYTSSGSDSMVFVGEGVKAIIKSAPFQPEKHKLSYDEKLLIRIDKKPYYGDYGKMPKTQINEVIFIWANDTVQIPPYAFNDLFNPHFTYLDKGVQRTANAIYKSKDGRRYYLYLFSKDNSGSYEVTWIFQDGRYVRRVLDYGFM